MVKHGFNVRANSNSLNRRKRNNRNPDNFNPIQKESVLKEEMMLVFETNGNLVTTTTINPRFYPLVTHFAAEQVRWENGGNEPTLVMGEPIDKSHR